MKYRENMSKFMLGALRASILNLKFPKKHRGPLTDLSYTWIGMVYDVYATGG